MAFIYKYADDDKTSILTNDKGLPIIINDEKDEDSPDRESAIDALHLLERVPELQNTNKQLKETNEEMKGVLKLIKVKPEKMKDWIDKANSALNIVKNLDDKKLLDANEVETIKKQAEENFKTKYKEQEEEYKTALTDKDTEIGNLNSEIYQLLVSEQFANSKFVKDKLAMFPKAAFAYFRDCLKVEVDDSGKRQVVAYYPFGAKKGEKVYSKERVGEIPDLDEALELLVDNDPERDSLLQGTGAAGGGASGDGSGKVTSNPFKAGDDFNLTEAGKLFREDPDKARRLAKEAGVDLETSLGIVNK